MRGRHSDLNILERLSAHGGGCRRLAGVVVAALGSLLSGWLWLDPAISLVIAAVVLCGSWGLAHASVNLALDGVPEASRSRR